MPDLISLPPSLVRDDVFVVILAASSRMAVEGLSIVQREFEYREIACDVGDPVLDQSGDAEWLRMSRAITKKRLLCAQERKAMLLWRLTNYISFEYKHSADAIFEYLGNKTFKVQKNRDFDLPNVFELDMGVARGKTIWQRLLEMED